MTAGWMRIVGQVTAVVTFSFWVTDAIPPSTDQTNGLCPCSSSQGWKWSLIHNASKPACSARPAAFTSSLPGCSSLDRK